MTSSISPFPVICGSCGVEIPPGMSVFWLTLARLPRCVTCAALAGVALPDAVQGRQRPTAAPLDFSRFDKRSMAKAVRERILDWRARQAGSDR